MEHHHKMFEEIIIILFYTYDLTACGHPQLGRGNLAHKAPCPAPHYRGCSDGRTILGHALPLAEHHGALGVSSVSLYDTNVISSQKGKPGGLQGWSDIPIMLHAHYQPLRETCSRDSRFWPLSLDISPGKEPSWVASPDRSW